MLSKLDEGLGLKSPDVFLGNKSLRGLDVHEARFENINKNPEISSKNKNTNLPEWKYISERRIDFSHQVYNRNVYSPQTKAVNRRTEMGHQDMTQKIGRGEQPINDFYLAQAGAGSHLDLLE